MQSLLYDFISDYIIRKCFSLLESVLYWTKNKTKHYLILLNQPVLSRQSQADAITPCMAGCNWIRIPTPDKCYSVTITYDHHQLLTHHTHFPTRDEARGAVH